ncbi:MAG: type II toxin-antitoxin system RelB/DinJ family antitoxin [Coriobacteriia bacterium]|nr:type II toxin-antitoxin system RelB/DinJ family antitoxin [Coriobacteriia bacterium]
MGQAAVSFRMDAELKKKMDETCKSMGMSATTAYTLFAKKVTNERKIPFEITADAKPPLCLEDLTPDELDAELEKGEEDIRQGRVYTQEEVDAYINRKLNQWKLA